MAKTVTLSNGEFVLSGAPLKTPTPAPPSAVGAPRAKTDPTEPKQFSFPKSKVREMKQAALDLDYKTDSKFIIDCFDYFMRHGFRDTLKAKRGDA